MKVLYKQLLPQSPDLGYPIKGIESKWWIKHIGEVQQKVSHKGNWKGVGVLAGCLPAEKPYPIKGIERIKSVQFFGFFSQDFVSHKGNWKLLPSSSSIVIVKYPIKGIERPLTEKFMVLLVNSIDRSKYPIKGIERYIVQDSWFIEDKKYPIKGIESKEAKFKKEAEGKCIP